MPFNFYEPRVKEGGRSRNHNTSPAIRFSTLFMTINKQARALFETVPDKVKVGFDPESNAIKVVPVTKGGMALKKTKVYIKGFLRSFDLGCLVGQYIPVQWVDGGLMGYPDYVDNGTADNEDTEKDEDEDKEEDEDEDEEALIARLEKEGKITVKRVG